MYVIPYKEPASGRQGLEPQGENTLIRGGVVPRTQGREPHPLSPHLFIWIESGLHAHVYTRAHGSACWGRGIWRKSLLPLQIPKNLRKSHINLIIIFYKFKYKKISYHFRKGIF
jgi:hypothetical protein